MRLKILVRRQSHFPRQTVNVALMAVVVMFVISVTLRAQGRLPFTGTRTFCGISVDKGATTVVSIRKDGFTTVKTNIWTEPEGSYVTFFGKLNAKGILRRDRDIYLQVNAASDIVMMGPQDYVTSKLSAPREAPSEGSNDARRTSAPPPNEGNKWASAIQLVPSSEQILSLEEMVSKYGGTYSVDCRKLSAYQATIAADALMLKLGSKKIRGDNPILGGLLPQYKYITTDPSLKAAFSADVAPNVRMSFTVYDDKQGLYLLVIGHRKIEDAVQVDKDADERPVFRKCR
jgi:hypothetical protein